MSEIMPAASHIDITEQCEIEWREYLSQFDTKIFPLFAERGFSKDAALMTWVICRFSQGVDDLVQHFSDDDNWEAQ